MKTIHFKCIFPYNYYLARNVKIKTSSGNRYALGHLQTLSIETDNETWIEFKLDYHKYRLELKNHYEGDNLYLVVTLKCRNTFPYQYTDVMFKNAMLARVVTQEEFENYEGEHQISPPKFELKVKDYIALAINILVFSTYVLLSIFSSQVDPSDQNFLFIIGLACIVGNFRFIVKKEAELKAFKLTMGLNLYIALVLLIMMDFDYSFENSIWIVASLTYLLTAINTQQPKVVEQ